MKNFIHRDIEFLTFEDDMSDLKEWDNKEYIIQNHNDPNDEGIINLLNDIREEVLRAFSGEKNTKQIRCMIENYAQNLLTSFLERGQIICFSKQINQGIVQVRFTLTEGTISLNLEWR